MAKLTFTKRSFSGGELSPAVCQSRTDLDIYSHGVSQCTNCIPLPTGSLVHRPYTISYPKLDIPKNASRLLAFSLTGDKVALFVFGHNEMIYVLIEGSNPPQVIAKFPTPYTQYEAEQLDYARNDTLVILAHKNRPPHMIQFTEEKVIFAPFNVDPHPWLPMRQLTGAIVDCELRIIPSQTQGQDIQVTADVPIFKPTDAGRMIRLGWSPPAWKPQTHYEKGDFVCGGDKVYRCIHSGKSTDKWSCDPKTKEIYVQDGDAKWLLIGMDHLTPRYVWGSIKDIRTPFSIQVKLHNDFRASNTSRTKFWNLSSWGGGAGYPHHVSFYQDRLVFSGTGADPLTLHLSEYRNFNSFSPDTTLGDVDYTKALSVGLSDDDVREIRWFMPMERGLLVGTDASVWLVFLSVEQGFHLMTRRLLGEGVAQIYPVSVGNSVFFVQYVGRRIKAISGSIERGFRFVDVNRFAEHLFDHRIKQMAFQGDPYSIVWLINGDQQLLGCSVVIEGDQEHFAWHSHQIAGRGTKVHSLVVHPNEDQGETTVWFLISRNFEEGKPSVVLEKLGSFYTSEAQNLYGDGFSGADAVSGGF